MVQLVRPGYLLQSSLKGAAGAVTIWDSSNLISGESATNITNNGRTYSPTVAGFHNGRSTTSKTTGKWYFEVTSSYGSGGGGVPGVGVVSSALANNTFTTSGVTGCGATIMNYGEIRLSGNGSAATGTDTYFSGGTVALALDLDNWKFYGQVVGGTQGWNYSNADPANNTGTISLSQHITQGTPVFIAIDIGGANGSWTLNSGHVPFLGTVPSGYQAWG